MEKRIILPLKDMKVDFDSMLPIFGAMVHSLHFTGNSTGVTSK